MLSDCGNSFCNFFKKIFHINKSKNYKHQFKRCNIITNRSVINSNDLNKYLFADECESCKHKHFQKSSAKIIKKTNNHNYKEYIKTEDLGSYNPPIIESCESFQSIDSNNDTDSDIESDIESDDEPINLNMINYNNRDNKDNPFIKNDEKLVDIL